MKEDDVPLTTRIQGKSKSLLSSNKASKPTSPKDEDDVPLAQKMKALKTADEEDDIPLAAKAKKIKATSVKASNGSTVNGKEKIKRPASPDDDDVPLAKKMKQMKSEDSKGKKNKKPEVKNNNGTNGGE